MSGPLVSIIIPVYNSEKYLADCINSALCQTWQPKEIIIVDDGSTDGSAKMAQSFAGEAGIKIISQKNQGAAAARNAGLKEAKGEFIQFLDADDLLGPEKIEQQMALLNGSLTQLAIGHTVHFDDGESPDESGIDFENGAWYSKENNDTVDFLIKLYAGKEVLPGYGGMIAVHSWLTPRKLIENAGPWDERLSLDDDGEFFCRVALAADGIRHSPRAVNYYRKYGKATSMSAQKSKKAVESAVLAIDLKYAHLKARSGEGIVDPVFARHYWWAGVLAYPQFKTISAYCIKKAGELGYGGEKYVGGRSGHLLAAFAGWKTARMLAYYRNLLKPL